MFNKSSYDFLTIKLGKRPHNSNCANFPKLNFAIKRNADKRVKSLLYNLNIILLKFQLEQYFSYLDFGRVELAIERNGAPRLSYWADPSIGSRNIFPAFTLRVIKFTPPPNSVLTHKQQHMPSWPFQAPPTRMNLKFRQIILAHDFNWLSELTFQRWLQYVLASRQSKKPGQKGQYTGGRRGKKTSILYMGDPESLCGLCRRVDIWPSASASTEFYFMRGPIG